MDPSARAAKFRTWRRNLLCKHPEPSLAVHRPSVCTTHTVRPSSSRGLGRTVRSQSRPLRRARDLKRTQRAFAAPSTALPPSTGHGTPPTQLCPAFMTTTTTTTTSSSSSSSVHRHTLLTRACVPLPVLAVRTRVLAACSLPQRVLGVGLGVCVRVCVVSCGIAGGLLRLNDATATSVTNVLRTRTCYIAVCHELGRFTLP